MVLPALRQVVDYLVNARRRCPRPRPRTTVRASSALLGGGALLHRIEVAVRFSEIADPVHLHTHALAHHGQWSRRPASVVNAMSTNRAEHDGTARHYTLRWSQISPANPELSVTAHDAPSRRQRTSCSEHDRRSHHGPAPTTVMPTSAQQVSGRPRGYADVHVRDLLARAIARTWSA
jgi:hypothetical protein